MTRQPTATISLSQQMRNQGVDIRQLYALSRQLNTPQSISLAFGWTSSPAVSIGGDESYLSISGGVMIGPIAYHPIAFMLVSNELDVGKNSGAYSSRVIITGQGSANDNLDAIINAAHAGQILNIQGVIGITITIRDKTIATSGNKNINLRGIPQIKLVGNQNITLVFDSIANEWSLDNNLTASNWSQFLATSDIEFSTTGIDIGNTAKPVEDLFVKQIRLQTGIITPKIPMITRIANDMIFNVDDLEFFDFRFFNVSKHTFSKTTFTTQNISVAGLLALTSVTSVGINGNIGKDASGNVNIFSGGAVKNITNMMSNPSTSNLNMNVKKNYQCS